MQPLEPITEKELDIAGKNKAIEQLRVQQLENGKFSIIAKLTWRPAEQVLFTQRKKVRGWASLDRLLKHTRDKYGIESQINVTLQGETK